MTALLSSWHFLLHYGPYLTGIVTYQAWRLTPWSKMARRRAAVRSAAMRAERRLRKAGKPDENGWRPRTNYGRQ